MTTKEEQLKAFDRLLTIMEELREKCPWDKKQTMTSLRHLTIEETYELADAILENNLEEIKKELGDLLLHLVFYAKIASESKAFDIGDVANVICDKLIDRHPHIYGNITMPHSEAVKQNWEILKLKKENKSVLQGVPKSLPAMVKATRIQEKAAAVGFDWEQSREVLKKITEELQELQTEIDNNKSDTVEEEFGDLLFSVVNYARFLGVNPENALEKTNKKFIRRFSYIEEQANDLNKGIYELNSKEMNHYWEVAKREEK